MHRLEIVIVTPAMADANNGNWQTASRWARLLSPAYRVRLVGRWQGGDEALMIALHARRSADSIAAWQRLRPGAPLVLALTGTDLYRDIVDDDSAQASLQAAQRLVVLNELGARALPPALRPRVRVVLQSCPARRPVPHTGRHLRALMVGHLRAEKDPMTWFGAVRCLGHRTDLRFDHIGAALDPALGRQAQALQAEVPRYRWLGALPHGAVRRRIQAAHLLVHPSRIEGGAHVVIEALRSGTPVLASRIDGNVGLLGARHPGLFPPGDVAALAALVAHARDEPAMLDRLRAAGDARAARFDPAQERNRLQAVLAECLPATPDRPALTGCR